jgi:hypothetical protein
MSEKATKQNPHTHINRAWRTVLKLLLLVLIVFSVGLGITITKMKDKEEFSIWVILKLILLAVGNLLSVFGVLMYTQLNGKSQQSKSEGEADKPDDKKE